jgi:hypothetical protein
MQNAMVCAPRARITKIYANRKFMPPPLFSFLLSAGGVKHNKRCGLKIYRLVVDEFSLPS